MPNKKMISKRPNNKRVSSQKQLENAIIKPTAKGVVNGLANATGKKLIQNIQENVYDSYEPNSYQRTGQFINAVRISKMKTTSGVDKVEASVYIDSRAIKPYVTNDKSEWNQHADVNGTPFTTPLIDVLENGTYSGLFKRKGAHFIEDTMNWLDVNGAKEVTNISSQYYNITREIEGENEKFRVPKGIKIVKKK